MTLCFAFTAKACVLETGRYRQFNMQVYRACRHEKRRWAVPNIEKEKEKDLNSIFYTLFFSAAECRATMTCKRKMELIRKHPFLFSASQTRFLFPFWQSFAQSNENGWKPCHFKKWQLCRLRNLYMNTKDDDSDNKTSRFTNCPSTNAAGSACSPSQDSG